MLNGCGIFLFSTVVSGSFIFLEPKHIVIDIDKLRRIREELPDLVQLKRAIRQFHMFPFSGRTQVDLELNRMLFQSVPINSWEDDEFNSLGSEAGLSDPDDIFLPLKELLGELNFIKFDILPYESSGDFTTLAFENYENRKGINDTLSKAILKEMRLKTRLPPLREKYLVIYGTTSNGQHYTFNLVDLDDGRFIFMESVRLLYMHDNHYAQYLMELLQETARNQTLQTTNRAFENRQTVWKSYSPISSLQSDRWNCGFYMFIIRYLLIIYYLINWNFGYHIYNIDMVVGKRNLTDILQHLPELSVTKRKLDDYRSFNYIPNRRHSDIDEELNYLLYPSIPHFLWKDGYNEICSDSKLNQPDFVYVPIMKLLSQLSYIKVGTLEYEISYGFTSRIVDLMSLDFDELFNDTKTINLMNSFVPALTTSEFQIFNQRFLAFFGTLDAGLHYTLHVLDLDEGYLISFESIKYFPRLNHMYVERLVQLLQETAKRLNIVTNFKAFENKKFEWQLKYPHTSEQKDNTNCGFYVVMNMKFFSHRILTKFKNRAILQFKFLTAYEILRNKLFPLGIPVY
ncbi:hypothetical protein SNEBB_005923 [Seison nebaliae]|nr:hypothetical protein SNEBB_005923 [Seison nebaliae]